MKFNDYIFEDLKLHKWELNSSYSFEKNKVVKVETKKFNNCLLYTSPSPRDV